LIRLSELTSRRRVSGSTEPPVAGGAEASPLHAIGGRRRHWAPPGAAGHHRAPSAATGRHRAPTSAKLWFKRPDSHHFAELDRTDGHPASPATPTATPPALPRRRPPRQPCRTGGRLTSPLLAPRLDSPHRSPSPQRSCRRIVPARTPAGRRLRGPRTRGGPRQTDPP